MSDNELRDRIWTVIADTLCPGNGGYRLLEHRDAAQAVIDDLGLTMEHGAAFSGEVVMESTSGLAADEAARMVAWNPGMKHMVRAVGKWENT